MRYYPLRSGAIIFNGYPLWRFQYGDFSDINSSMFLGNFVLNKSLKIGRLFDLITEYVDSGSLLMMESAGGPHHPAQWEVILMIDIFT